MLNLDIHTIGVIVEHDIGVPRLGIESLHARLGRREQPFALDDELLARVEIATALGESAEHLQLAQRQPRALREARRRVAHRCVGVRLVHSVRFRLPRLENVERTARISRLLGVLPGREGRRGQGDQVDRAVGDALRDMVMGGNVGSRRTRAVAAGRSETQGSAPKRGAASSDAAVGDAPVKALSHPPRPRKKKRR